MSNRGGFEIEDTETGMVQETETVRTVLHRLRGLGFEPPSMNFGTGFSSMSNLKNMPVREVKIDQSFVPQHPEFEARDQEIARGR